MNPHTAETALVGAWQQGGTMIAALYVRTGGVYFDYGLPDDWYDAE